MNKRIKSIKELILLHEGTIDSLQKELVDAHSCRFLKCGCCGKKSQVKKIKVLDIRYLNPNTGSPNGSFWEHGYWAWICPYCGIYRDNQIDENLYWEMKNSFKERGVKAIE